MKALVAGWFSFEGMGATAGDLMARDVVCSWLPRSGWDYDIAVAPPFVDGVAWQSTNPADYAAVVFVCGPFGNGEPLTPFLAHFRSCRLVGLDVSMLQAIEEWNPFDLLLERDSATSARPDLSLLAPEGTVPVVGLLLVHAQSEYGSRGRHADVDAMIEGFLAGQDAAIVRIDTRLDENKTGLRTSQEVESLIRQMDVIVTTRLHGLVLGLKNGVPVVAIDAIAGGAKVTSQAKALGWPLVLSADDLSEDAIGRAYTQALEPASKALAQTCVAAARCELAEVERTFAAFLAQGGR